MKTATQLKFEGLQSAAKHHAVDLARAQQIAYALGLLGHPISADDVREAFLKREGRKLDIGNGMGSLFKGKHWQCAGFMHSKRPGSHHRTLRTWVLKQKEVYHPEPVAPAVGTDNGVRFCHKCYQETDKCSCPTL